MRRHAWLMLPVLLVLALPALGADAPATPGRGTPALLVLDTQNAFLPYMDAEGRDVTLQSIGGWVQIFRDRGLPVIRIYHTDPAHGPAPGTEPFEFPATVRVRPDDPMVVKNHPSAFKKTELERVLRERGIDTIFIAGLSATGCALATYYDGVRLDFNTFMIKDALLSPRLELTRSVEEITEAVGYYALLYMLPPKPGA